MIGPVAQMAMDRRHILGLAVSGLAGLVISPARAWQQPGTIQQTLMDGALAALDRHGASIVHRDLIALADFGAASRAARFHLVDLDGGGIVSMHVAHGIGSDPANTGFVQRFSNLPGSNASSRGSFVTGESYVGKHGRSRRLAGLDPDNSLAEQRAIVIHAATYVGADIARATGRVGRSQGCFAVSPAMIDMLLSRLGPGRLLFAAGAERLPQGGGRNAGA